MNSPTELRPSDPGDMKCVTFPPPRPSPGGVQKPPWWAAGVLEADGDPPDEGVRGAGCSPWGGATVLLGGSGSRIGELCGEECCCGCWWCMWWW